MKRLLLVPFLAASALLPSVHAAEHTVTLGYAKSEVKEGYDLAGFNAKYRYEWNSPVSIIGSLSYLYNSNHSSEENPGSMSYRFDSSVKYYSLAAGPAWRLNDHFSLYGLVGLNYIKMKYNSQGWSNNFGRLDYNDDDKDSRTSFIYGAGVQINAWQNVTVDVGYEGTRAFGTSINGFNIGLGYRF